MSLEAYAGAVSSLAVLAALMIVQLLVADVTGIRRRHVPGTPVTPDHADALFRVTRTLANTNESVAIFIVLLLYCMLGGASPVWTAWGAWAYVICRMLYAVCYYANLPTYRSISFGLSLLALLAMLITGLAS